MIRTIAIIGQTGLGKTELAIKLAKILNLELVNCDALQVYKELPIATNKSEHFHHLMGIRNHDCPYSVTEFERDAMQLLATRPCLLVGGTHYYLQYLLFGNELEKTAYIPPDISNLTPQQKYELLKEIYPDAATKLHHNDVRRVTKALELGPRIQKQRKSRFECLIFWLYANDLAELDARLESRVEEMIKRGLIDELASIPKSEKETGVYAAIGYKEFREYFVSPNLETLSKCIELTKIATRQYARKQLNWINNKLIPSLDENIVFYPVCAENIDLSHVEQVAKDYLNLKPLIVPFIKAKVKEPWQKYHCEKCNQTVNGLKEWKQHMESRRHRRIKFT